MKGSLNADCTRIILLFVSVASGKKIFPTEYMSNDILYSAFITPAVHYTMGGLKINPEAQVLQSHQPVTNLFAAGKFS